MRYEILLFDLDGTLLDFDASEHAALIKLFAAHGITVTDELIETYKTVNNGFWRAYERGEISMSVLLDTRFGKTMSHFGIDIDGASWEKEYRGYLGDFAFIIDEADDILKKLASCHRVFAVTNGVGDTQINRLKLAGIIDCFEDIFVSQLVGAQKPSKMFFDYVERNIAGFDKSKALIIGDSLLTDIAGGMNAGIDTCFVNLKGKRHDQTPTYEISKLSDLIKICN